MRSDRAKVSEASEKILRNMTFNRSGSQSQTKTDDQLVYVQIAMDPEYYSPYEVSYRFRGTFSSAANRARPILSPTSDAEHPATSLAYDCVKYAHILVAGNDRLETFDFVLPVPGAALSAQPFAYAFDSAAPIKVVSASSSLLPPMRLRRRTCADALPSNFASFRSISVLGEDSGHLRI